MAASVDAIRAWFPSLQSEFVFLENAGGSQVPACVADAIRDFMLSDYVQVGAYYPASERATKVLADAHEWMRLWMNAGPAGTVAFGANATTLTNMIGMAYERILGPGDEVIVSEANHEANAGAWSRLERIGVTVKWWRVDPETLESRLEDLASLLNDRTRVVAFPHVSNLLGDVADVKAITDLCHQAGARVFVDGVAYAPHGVIDVEGWGVDWYVFSNYKVYGPHMGTLYGRNEAFLELPGPGHFFIEESELPRKWETGAYNYEGCAGLLGQRAYIRHLSGREDANRAAIVDACETMGRLEAPLTAQLIDYLGRKTGVRLISPQQNPIGTISFLSDRIASQEIPKRMAERAIGMRAGHMYSYRLCESLGIDLNQGVARISLLHYNTQAEIDRCIQALDEIL